MSRGRPGNAFAVGFVVVLLLFALAVIPSARAIPGPGESAQAMTVTVVLDRTSYVNGDTPSATAIVYRTPGPTNYTFTWAVLDSFGQVINTTANGTENFQYLIPLDYLDTVVTFEAAVDDGQGLTVVGERTVGVSVGVMALRLDRGEFVPGDTITATYSVRSNVILQPTYDYEVDDSTATIVHSGNTNTTSFSFHTPSPASRTYAFLVTARDGANQAQARATIAQVSGVVLGVAFDKASYAPGETVRAHLTVTSRGTTALPSQFEWFLFTGPFGTVTATAITTVPEADLSLTLPLGLADGDILFLALESRTSSVQYVTVHIGATSPLWTTELGGIPLFAILLGLLFILLLVAVLGLWRRMSGGLVAPGTPTIPPLPATPLGPLPTLAEAPVRPPSAAPMSVTCQHCGKPIELSTSKRPIEVMCPSCGETQVVA